MTETKFCSMPTSKTAFTLASGIATLAGTCWLIAGALPLPARPQIVQDGRLVAVDLMGSQLLHRVAVKYPDEALAAGISGTVVAQVTLDGRGNVADAAIISGPGELRKSVLQSVLSWHFRQDAANSTRRITVTFTAPVQANKTDAAMPGSPTLAGASGAPSPRFPQLGFPQKGTVNSIKVYGLAIPTAEVLSKLPLHVGDQWDHWEPSLIESFEDAVHQFDEHLNVSWYFLLPDRSQLHVDIKTPEYNAAIYAATPQPTAVTVDAAVQAKKLIFGPPAAYPPVPPEQRLSGTVTVTLEALIGPDGHIQRLAALSGHPPFQQAALDAVNKWVYKPTLLNDQPVAVSTTVDVIFEPDN